MDPDLPLTRLRVHNPQTVFSLFPFSTQRLDSLRYIARLHIHRILNRITFHTAPTVSVTSIDSHGGCLTRLNTHHHQSSITSHSSCQSSVMPIINHASHLSFQSF